MLKRTIFVAYSAQKQTIATEIKNSLEEEFDVVLWKDDERGGGILLDNIISKIRTCQYGIAILSCDDQLQIEDKAQEQPVLQWAPRDNVILELGFFLSKFGKARTAIISVMEPNGKTPKIPTNMAGWFTIQFNAGKSVAATKYASDQIRKHFGNKDADIIPTLGKDSSSPRGFNVLTMDDIKEHWGQFTGKLYCLNPSWNLEHHPEWVKIHCQRYHNPDFIEANYIIDIDRGRDAKATTNGLPGKARVVDDDHDLYGIVKFFKALCETDGTIRPKIDSKLKVFISPGVRAETTTFVSEYRKEHRGFLFVREDTFINAVLEANTPEQVQRLYTHLFGFMNHRKPFNLTELEDLSDRIVRP